jgi:hypothetical protein
MLRVETVSFATRVRLPDGRVETSISMQNQHHKLNYEMFCDPDYQTVTIRSAAKTTWTVLVPFANCSFITLESGTPTVRRTRKGTRVKPPVERAKTKVLPSAGANGRE